MMIPSELKNFKVQNTKPDYYLRDVAVFHATEGLRENTAIKVRLDGRELCLACEFDSRISPGRIALNSHQIEFLGAKIRQSVVVDNEVESSSLESIAKVEFVVSHLLRKLKPKILESQMPSIIAGFQSSLGTPKILNLGHSVTILVGSELVTMKVERLLNSKRTELPFGVLRDGSNALGFIRGVRDLYKGPFKTPQRAYRLT